MTVAQEVTSVVTDVGVTAAIDAGASGPDIIVTGFRIGTQSAAQGAVALTTDTDVDGRVYDGDISAMTYTRINANTVAWRIMLGAEVGDFDVGQIGIVVEGGILFAKAVLPGRQNKWQSRPPALIGDTQFYTVLMTLTNVANLLNVTMMNTLEASLPEVPTELDLPSPLTTPFNAYLVRNHTHIGQPTVAVRANSTWNHAPHFVSPNQGIGVAATAPTNFQTDSLAYGSHAAPTVGVVSWNSTSKKFVAADSADPNNPPIGLRTSSYQVTTLGMIAASQVGISGALTVGTAYYAAGGTDRGLLSTTQAGPVLAVAVSTTDLFVDTTRLWLNWVGSEITTVTLTEANSVTIDVSGDVLDGTLKPGSVVYAALVSGARHWYRADPLDGTNVIKRPIGILSDDKKRVIVGGQCKITNSPNDWPTPLTIGSLYYAGGSSNAGKVLAGGGIDAWIVGEAVAADTIDVRFVSAGTYGATGADTRQDNPRADRVASLAAVKDMLGFFLGSGPGVKVDMAAKLVELDYVPLEHDPALRPTDQVARRRASDGHYVTAMWSEILALCATPMRSAGASLALDVTSATTLTVSSAAAQMLSSTGVAACKPLSDTVNTATSGVGGLDVGTLGTGHYFVYAVSDGTAVRAVMSASAVGPDASILATYPCWCLLASVYVTATGLRAIRKRGNEVQFILGGPNVASLPLLASGLAGTGWSTYAAVSVTPIIPPTAVGIILHWSPDTYAVGGNVVAVSPSPIYGGEQDYTPNLAIFTINPAYNTSGGYYMGMVTYPFRFQLESSNIYWISGVSSAKLRAFGYWENC